MRVILTSLLSACLAFCVGTATVEAQQNKVVSTTRTNKLVDEQAVPIDILNREQIEAAMLMSPGDLLMLFNQMPGVHLQTTSPVLETTVVRLDGLPGRYTRLLFDGVHLFSDRPGGYALLRTPPMDVDHVEVLKGPAGAFYGSDSPAGAVNLIPRKPGQTYVREFLFNRTSRGGTDGVVFLATPATGPARSWSTTFLVGAHTQDETDGDHDGWSDIPKYNRGVIRPRVSWDNHRGRVITGVADVTFEKREGGTSILREAAETKTADGYMTGQMLLKSGAVLAGAGALFVQSRTLKFSDRTERDRLQTATIEITLSRQMTKHKWLGAIASDWYGLRSVDALPSSYISTRPGMFFHDDFTAARWLTLSGSLRLDHHNMYGVLASPRGSALLHSGSWAVRLSAAQGYSTPRLLNEETEETGVTRLKIAGPLEKETARSVSGDLIYKTGAAMAMFRVFRMNIDNPAQIDRTTYTLRTEADPISSRGVELFGMARKAPFSLTGTYTFARTREHDSLELPLVPRHSGTFVAAAANSRGRIALETVFTGKQRLERNPYRTTSEAFSVVSLLGELRFGRFRVFANGENLTDVRQTNWDPIERPARDIDGRWTVDAWAPLRGRVINGGLRIVY